MDPNEALKAIRILVKSILSDETDGNDGQDLVDLAEHVQALDEWLSKGGFLPDSWQR